MKAYVGTFLKKDGSQRTMTFIKVNDLPKVFLEGRIKGTGRARTLADGSETVYDVDAKEFRIFNHNTVVGSIVETDLDDDMLI